MKPHSRNTSSADYGARFNEELARHIEGDGSELTWLLPVE